MKKILTICTSCLLVGLIMTGCATVPATPVSLPEPPKKPEIKAVVVNQGNTPIVGYDIPSWLKLYAWWAEQDAYISKLLFRIEQTNKLLVK